jgi:hypothetical protein
MSGLALVAAPISGAAQSVEQGHQTRTGAFAVAGLPDWDAADERRVTQLVWDAGAGRLTRETVTLWDLYAAEDLELRWMAEDDRLGDASHPDGAGEIEWRQSGRASHDRDAWVATFSGTLHAGRPHGEGRLRHRSGIRYEGAWRDGRFHGAGRLQWPDGREYRGAFVDGLPHGLGELYRPDGSIHIGRFVAGQPEGAGMALPLTARAYISEWSAGAEVAGARLALDGVAGIEHVQPVQQDATSLRVNVAVDPQESWGNWDILPLAYTGVSDGAVLRVFPEPEEFLERWRGDLPLIIRSGFPDGFRGFSFRTTGRIVAFNIGFENASVLPQQVVGGYLDVQSSRSALEPALEILNGHDCVEGLVVDSFSIRNFGWSDPINAQIRGGFDVPGSDRQILPIAQTLAPAWPLNNVDFGSFFASLGGQLTDFRDLYVTCVGGDVQGCFQTLQQQGAFGALTEVAFVPDEQNPDGIYARFSGVLDYDWQDANGQLQQNSHPLSVRFRLARFRPETGCGEGGSGLQQVSTNLTLRLDQSAYRLPFPIFGAVSPGFVQTWRLLIDAEKSSFHDFSIVLQLADGREVRSRPISLTYFRSSDPAQY